MAKRIVLVDDDDLSRRGMEGILTEHDVVVIASVTHDGFDEAALDWHAVDVVVVDAADERQATDQFPGVAVVEAVRRHRHPGQTTIIVITGHFLDDGLRRRMREAQADFFFNRTELRRAEHFTTAVLEPDAARRGVPGPTRPEFERQLGIGSTTRVNAAVRLAGTQGGAGGRRAAARARQRFNEVAQLHPSNADGTTPDRNQAIPSRTQIARFLEWATRTKPRD